MLTQSMFVYYISENTLTIIYSNVSCTIKFIYKTTIDMVMKFGKSIKWDTHCQQTN